MSNISADVSIEIIKSFSDISREIVVNCYPIIGEFVHHALIAFGALYLIWTAIRYYLMVGGDPDLRMMFITLFKIMICIGISGSYETFYNFFYSPLMDFFQGLPIIVVKASMGNKVGSYYTVLHMLSDSVSNFKELSFNGIGKFRSWFGSSILNILFSFILGIIFFALLCSFIIINVFAIVSANMILMLAPIIIGLAAFEPTKKYATNMVNSFITYAIRPTFSAISISIVVFVLSKFQITSTSFVDNLGEWLTVTIIGLIGIVLQLRTEEYASAITSGAIGSSSGIIALATGGVAGAALAGNTYQGGKGAVSGGILAGRTIAEGARSAGGMVANGAIKAFEGVKHRYMQV
jgi:type IV secretory pathway VirB6-like protein